jgi:hypothetical protein
MNFVISSSDPYQKAPELLRVCAWLSNRFGETVTTDDEHSTFNLYSGSNPKVIEILDLLRWDHSLTDIYSLWYHESVLGFAVYQILFAYTDDRYRPSSVDIIVSIDDEMLALECKLACI